MSVFTELFEDLNELGEIIFEGEEEYKKLESSYTESDIGFLFKKLNEYSPNKSKKYLRKYLNTVLFISYFYENNSIHESKHIKDIILFLKSELDNKFNNNDLEYYSYILRALFSINREELYFLNNYKKLDNKGYLYSDIITRFTIIFKELNNKELFIDSYKNLNLIKNYGFGFEEGFNYLLSLNDKDFSKLFSSFIDFFVIAENKEKLVRHHQYKGIFSNEFNSNLGEKIKKLLCKISSNKTSDLEKILFDFSKSEISFSLNKFSNVKDLTFVLSSLDYLLKKDTNLYLELFSDIDFKSWSFEYADFLSSYVKHGDENKIFEILKEKDSVGFILRLNDSLKNNKIKGQRNIIKEFKKYKEVQDIYKQREKAYKENDDRVNKEIKKEKKEILNALRDVENKRKEEGKIFYSPKLVYEYKNKQLETRIDEKKRLNKIFSNIQFKKIQDEVIKSIGEFFGIYEKLDYKWFYEQLSYNQLEENRVSYPSIIINGTVDTFLNVGFVLKIDLSKYKKSLLGFMPFLSLSKYENIDDKSYIEYLEKGINSNDIDYILSIYSTDRDKKDDTRYCQPENLFIFFDKFKNKFTDNQKKEFYKILESFVFNEKLFNHHNIKSLDYLKESGSNKSYFKKIFKNNYIEFNYFNDVLKNIKGLEKEEINKLKILSKINEILIEKYKDDKAIKWRIIQLKEGKIDIEDSFKITYPQKSVSTSIISDGYDEIYGFGSNRERFFNVLMYVKDLKYKSIFLDLLKESFGILLDVEENKIDSNFKRYGIYLQEAFFAYLEGFQSIDLEENYLKEIENLIESYPEDIKYIFDNRKLNRLFGINYKEQAVEILKKGPKAIESLLKKNNYILKNNNILKKDNDNLKNKVDFFENNYPNIKEEIILYIEGKWDKKYLNMAYQVLNQKQKLNYTVPFIVNAGGHRGVKAILDDYSRNSNNEKKIIGMFDFDDAFSSYNSLANFEQKNHGKYEECLYSQHISKTLYLLLLPVSLDSELKGQVLYEVKDDNGMVILESFLDKSMLEIEHLFYDFIDDNSKDLFFSDELVTGGGKIKVINDSNKDKFYSYIEKNINTNENLFNNFKPILEFIENVRLGRV